MATKLRLEWDDFDQEPENGSVDGPLWDDVRAILEHLDKGEAGFVILSRGDEAFVQTAFRDGDPEEGFIVEFRDGGPERHVELDEGFVPLERVVGVFEWFFSTGKRAEGDWAAVEWED